MNDNAFDALRDWTCDLAELHAAFSDPVWQKLGIEIPTGRAGTFGNLLRLLVETCQKHGVTVSPGSHLDELMWKLRQKLYLATVVDNRLVSFCCNAGVNVTLHVMVDYGNGPVLDDYYCCTQCDAGLMPTTDARRWTDIAIVEGRFVKQPGLIEKFDPVGWANTRDSVLKKCLVDPKLPSAPPSTSPSHSSDTRDDA